MWTVSGDEPNAELGNNRFIGDMGPHLIRASLTTVLIIDDDPLVHAVVEGYFRDKGVPNIVSVYNGSKALELISQRVSEINLIVCAMKSRDTDGLQILRHLAAARYDGQIALLSSENSATLQMALNLANAHGLNIVSRIQKPVRAHELDIVFNALSTPVPSARAGNDVQITTDDLQTALRSGQIKAAFQAKIDLVTGLPSGAEALARWDHPKLGRISPDVFVPLVEYAGLVEELTWLMVDYAIEALQEAKRRGQRLKIAVNTNASTLNQLSFPNELASRIKQAGLGNDQLQMEVTESALLSKGACSVEVMARLRMMQFDVSIDDFGTGRSSIAQLGSFPFSEMKIDRSFLTDFVNAQTRRACLKAVVALARSLSLRTVLEGVETDQELALAKELGIDEAQGYLFSRPMPMHAFIDWLDQWSGSASVA